MNSNDSGNISPPSAAELAERFRASGAPKDTLVRVLEMFGRPIRGADIILPRIARPSALVIARVVGDDGKELTLPHYQWARNLPTESFVSAEAWCLQAAWSFGALTVVRAALDDGKMNGPGLRGQREVIEALVGKKMVPAVLGQPSPQAVVSMLKGFGGAWWSFHVNHHLFTRHSEEDVRKALLRDRTIKRNGRRAGDPPIDLLGQLISKPHSSAKLAKARTTTRLDDH
ncbi:MAG: hypothetical protein QM757_44100 [Paludibaculum sp.]